MPIGPILGGLSAVVGASAARKGAKDQAAAANSQTALNERVYEETVDRFEPYATAGLDYQNALRFELLGGDRPTFGGQAPDIVEFTETIPGQVTSAPAYGNPGGWIRDPSDQERWIDPRSQSQTRTRYRVGDQIFDERGAADAYAQANPTGGYEYGGYTATPGYQFQLDQGIQAIDNSAASSGNLFSGATMKAAQSYGQGLASQDYGNHLNRLTQGAASGQAAAGNQANAGANFLQTGTNALANYGNAQAAGAIGVGNAINNGLNNAVGLWNYQNQQSQPSMFTASNGIRIPNSLFNSVQGVL